MDFKNSIVWLMGMKKLIFDNSDFFGSGHFLINDMLIIDHKMTGAKKVTVSKN